MQNKIFNMFSNLTTQDILQMMELEKAKKNDMLYYNLSNSDYFQLWFSETKGNAKQKYIEETLASLNNFVEHNVLSDDIVKPYKAELKAISYLSDDKCTERCIKFIKPNVKKIDKISDNTVKQKHIFCLKYFCTIMAICTVNSQMVKFAKNNFYIMDDNRLQMDMKGSLVRSKFDYSIEQVQLLVKVMNSALPKEIYNKYPRF